MMEEPTVWSMAAWSGHWAAAGELLTIPGMTGEPSVWSTAAWSGHWAAAGELHTYLG